MFRRRWLSPLRVLCAAVLCAAGLLAGCTSAAPVPTPTTPSAAPAAAAGGGALKGICPDPIVFQTNWWPEPDHAIAYQLIGPNGQIDASRNTYSGPLGNSGVQVEIRAGGPALGFQPVSSLMYQDDAILFGTIGTDDQIGASATQPTKAVLAWYAKNPQIYFWGKPEWDFRSVAEIGRSGATVLAYPNGAYLEVLIGKGLLQRGQVDTSYTGDPARFVAADGNLVSQGFVTSEPYVYEHEVNGWRKRVKYLLLNDEVATYQNTLVTRADKAEAYRACLQKLVPMLQQAGVDYLRDPAPVNGVLADFTSRVRGGTPITAANAAEATQLMLSLGIVANGADGTFGSYDPARVQALINDFGPVFEARGKPPRANLTAADLVTNEFLDPAIKL